MGIFSRFLGLNKKNNRANAIRRMAMIRLEDTPPSELMRTIGISNISEINDWSEIKVMQLPDATGLTITEKFVSLRHAGFSETEALQNIEQNRNMAVGGASDYPKEFIPYLVYRIKIEHGDITDDQIRFIYQCSKTWLVGNENA
jgi:hypothetical protein